MNNRTAKREVSQTKQVELKFYSIIEVAYPLWPQPHSSMVQELFHQLTISKIQNISVSNQVFLKNIYLDH